MFSYCDLKDRREDSQHAGSNAVPELPSLLPTSFVRDSSDELINKRAEANQTKPRDIYMCRRIRDCLNLSVAHWAGERSEVYGLGDGVAQLKTPFTHH